MQRMSYGYRKHRRKQDGEDHILPLINIVFLLLSFFLIAGKIEMRSPVPVSEPTSISETDDNTRLPTVQIDKDGQFLIDGEPVDPAAQDRLHAALSTEEALRVHADAAASASAVLDVLQHLRAAGWESVTLVTVRPSP